MRAILPSSTKTKMNTMPSGRARRSAGGGLLRAVFVEVSPSSNLGNSLGEDVRAHFYKNNKRSVRREGVRQYKPVNLQRGEYGALCGKQ